MGFAIFMLVSTLFAILPSSSSRTINIVDFGAVSGSQALSAANTVAINAAFAATQSSDVFLVPPGQFWALGGLVGSKLDNVTINIVGELVADPDPKAWPKSPGSNTSCLDFLVLLQCNDIRVYGPGSVDGQGKTWWNHVIIGLKPSYGRPHLITIRQSSNVTVANLYLFNSPSYHLNLDTVTDAEVYNLTIKVDRRYQQELKARLRANVHASSDVNDFPLQPEDLNTDGIDVSGQNVWVHDSYILNDDDSIAVKPTDGSGLWSNCSRNMRFERLVLTGFGASIGSVPPHPNVNCVQNITFYNIDMPGTGRGVYVKSNPECTGTKSAIIADITYENVYITKPRYWGIWIGPQQQHEPHEPLGSKCGLLYPLNPNCPTQGCVDFHDIILRNVTVVDPWLSPGVLLGNVSNPMRGIVFDGVNVINASSFPFGLDFKCEATSGWVRNSHPIPSCLTPRN